jgi:hypothetical protein
VKIQNLKNGGIAIRTASYKTRCMLLRQWPTSAFDYGYVHAHLPSYSDTQNKVIIKNAHQSDTRIEKMLEELLLNNEPNNSWNVIKVKRFNQKNSNRKIPVVLVQLLHKESVNLLLNWNVRNDEVY